MTDDEVVAVQLGLQKPRQETLHLPDVLERRPIGSGASGEIERIAIEVGHLIEQAIEDPMIVCGTVYADQ
jgi:hypothetical protein